MHMLADKQFVFGIAIFYNITIETEKIQKFLQRIKWKTDVLSKEKLFKYIIDFSLSNIKRG